jgi:hypothetical protein
LGVVCFLPVIEEYIVDDLFGGFFLVDDGKTKTEQPDKMCSVELFKGSLIA